MRYVSGMPETFLEPQPFNVSLEPEAEVTPAGRMPVLAPSLPVVAQVITADRDLYPARRYGMVGPGRVRA